ncbi:MAG: hypothetical protein IJH82_05630 [Lachnospiraceae bacterium]|nr:hypothetical protein [Lachnospiraceae bacterium]
MKKNDQRVNTAKAMQTALAVLGLILAAVLIIAPAIKTKAAGDVTFGSGSYDTENGQSFQIGVYVGPTDEMPIGEYTVTLTYDPNRLEYVGGAESGGGGTVTIHNRSEDGGRSMSMLTFRAVGNGTTVLSVTGATITDPEGNPMDTAGMASAPVNIRAQATPAPEYIRINGKDIPQLAADKNEYTFAIPYSEEFVVEVPEGYTAITDVTTLEVGRNEVALTLRSGDREPRNYTLHVNMQENKNKEETKPEPTPEPEVKPDEGQNENIKSEEIPETVSEEVSEKEKTSQIVLPEPKEKKSFEDIFKSPVVKTILLALGVVVLIVVIFFVKVIFDRIRGVQGLSNDFDRRRRMESLKGKETVQNKANPFEFASIDEEVDAKALKKREKEHQALTNEEGIVDLFGKGSQGSGKGAKKPVIEDEPEVTDGNFDLKLRETKADAVGGVEAAIAGAAATAADAEASEYSYENEDEIENTTAAVAKNQTMMAEIPVKKINFGVHRTSVEELAVIEAAKSSENADAEVNEGTEAFAEADENKDANVNAKTKEKANAKASADTNAETDIITETSAETEETANGQESNTGSNSAKVTGTQKGKVTGTGKGKKNSKKKKVSAGTGKAVTAETGKAAVKTETGTSKDYYEDEDDAAPEIIGDAESPEQEPEVKSVFPEETVTIADFEPEGEGSGDSFIDYDDEDDFMDIDDIPDRPAKK